MKPSSGRARDDANGVHESRLTRPVGNAPGSARTLPAATTGATVDPSTQRSLDGMAALAILGSHILIIAFNVAGCVLVPIGAWRRWRWVREFWWRLAHLLTLGVVAGQALAGRACFLTILQADAAGHTTTTPLIASWINRLIYWPLPLWVFAAAYVVVFVYVVTLWLVVRPRRPGARAAS